MFSAHHLAALMIFVDIIAWTSTVPVSEEGLLHRYLSNNYNKNAQPTNSTAPLQVDVDFKLIAIGDFKEELGTVQLSVYVTMVWRDYLLQWKESDHGGIPTTILPASEVWVPPFSVDSLAINSYEFRAARENSWVEVQSSGTVTWSFVSEVTVTCHLNTAMFPLDSHICTAGIISYIYPINKLYFVPVSNYIEYNYQPKVRQPVEWCLHASSVTQSAESVKFLREVSVMSVSILVTRRPSYHIMETVIPIALLSILVLIQFALPPHTQERITISGHVLIASVLLLLLATLSSPYTVASPRTLNGVYNLFLLCLNVVSVLLGVVVVRVNKSPGDERPPGWMRRMCSICRKCQPTKTQLHREPSYLSHMQMLRERINTITAPEWMHERQSPMTHDFLSGRPTATGGFPGGPLPPPPQYQNIAMSYDDMHHRATWIPEERLPPPPNDQANIRHRNNWPEGQSQGHLAALGPRPSYSHLEILISRQLHMLRTITETIHNKEQEDLNRLEWRLVANVLNTVFFFIILLIVLLAPLIIYLLIPNVMDNIDLEGYRLHQTDCQW